MNQKEDSMKHPLGTFRHFASCVVGLVVEDAFGDTHMGTAFHIGDGVLVTARHAVEEMSLVETICRPPASMTTRSIDILYPDDKMVDIALLVTDFRIAETNMILGDQAVEAADHIQLGMHLNDWIDDGLEG